MTRYHKGFTLIELLVATGLFSIVMLLASGAYLMMMTMSSQTQGVATGIDNLSFAVETMARNIRAGNSYNCNGLGDCQNGASSFTFDDDNGAPITYLLSGSTIKETLDNGQNYIPLTDSSVNVTSLMFYVSGTQTTQQSDYNQPHVTIVIVGTITYGHGKQKTFNIETGATMRGTDI